MQVQHPRGYIRWDRGVRNLHSGPWIAAKPCQINNERWQQEQGLQVFEHLYTGLLSYYGWRDQSPYQSGEHLMLPASKTIPCTKWCKNCNSPKRKTEVALFSRTLFLSDFPNRYYSKRRMVIPSPPSESFCIGGCPQGNIKFHVAAFW